MMGRKVKRTVPEILLFLLLASTLVCTLGIQPVASNLEGRCSSVLEITLELGSLLYRPGDEAEVHGVVTYHNIQVSDTQVTIKVLDPEDFIMDLSTVSTNLQGTFNLTFEIPFFADFGRYIVYANSSYLGEDANANASFDVSFATFLVKTNKYDYFPGEDVVITFLNGQHEVVGLNGVPPWDIFTYPEMEPVFPLYIAFMVWYIAPGEIQNFVWDQYNAFEERPADPGLYIAEARGIGLFDQEYAIFAIIARGDLNHDGQTDIVDILLAISAYGSREGDADWNPEADLAPPYGKINLFDLVTIAYHYGESW